MSGPGHQGRRPVAAVDCGTNSTRLLVAGPDGATLERLMRITRLGAAVDLTGHLSPGSVERTLEVLRDYRRVLNRHEVGDVLATATSAVRDASNAEYFLTEAAKVLGSVPRVLSGQEEGRLSNRGATAELAPAGGPFLVVDVGGGSTELVTSRDEGVEDLVTVSLQVGCVRLTERFLHDDPPSAEQQTSARRFVETLLAPELSEHPELRRATTMIGLAGTVSALAMLDLGLTTYDRDVVHHSRLTRKAVDDLTRDLAAMPLAKRRRLPGLEPDRADVIVGGATVLGAIMEGTRHEQLLVSESDILDGIVAELLSRRPSSPG